MKLTAEHFDGFSEHLLRWILHAGNGIAIIEASWFGLPRHVEQLFEMPFPDSRIQTFAQVLRTLKPQYDGRVDDLPFHSVVVDDGNFNLCTKVRAGFNWSAEDKSDVDAFMTVWRPLRRVVEKLLPIRQRGQ